MIQIKMAYNESIFPMARYSVFLHAGTDADFALLLKIHFIAEQNSIARQLQLSKDSLPTAPMSSPVSTTVGCSQLFIWK